MNYYEVLYIISSSLDDNAAKDVKREIEGLITTDGGDIYNRADWGRTRLAYEIDKQRYGNFVLVRFAAKGEFIRTLRDKLELMDAVLSSLVILLDSEPERIEEEIVEGAKEERGKDDRGKERAKAADAKKDSAKAADAKKDSAKAADAKKDSAKAEDVKVEDVKEDDAKEDDAKEESVEAAEKEE